MFWSGLVVWSQQHQNEIICFKWHHHPIFRMKKKGTTRKKKMDLPKQNIWIVIQTHQKEKESEYSQPIMSFLYAGKTKKNVWTPNQICKAKNCCISHCITMKSHLKNIIWKISTTNGYNTYVYIYMYRHIYIYTYVYILSPLNIPMLDGFSYQNNILQYPKRTYPASPFLCRCPITIQGGWWTWFYREIYRNILISDPPVIEPWKKIEIEIPGKNTKPSLA